MLACKPKTQKTCNSKSTILVAHNKFHFYLLFLIDEKGKKGPFTIYPKRETNITLKYLSHVYFH